MLTTLFSGSLLASLRAHPPRGRKILKLWLVGNLLLSLGFAFFISGFTGVLLHRFEQVLSQFPAFTLSHTPYAPTLNITVDPPPAFTLNLGGNKMLLITQQNQIPPNTEGLFLTPQQLIWRTPEGTAARNWASFPAFHISKAYLQRLTQEKIFWMFFVGFFSFVVIFLILFFLRGVYLLLASLFAWAIAQLWIETPFKVIVYFVAYTLILLVPLEFLLAFFGASSLANFVSIGGLIILFFWNLWKARRIAFDMDTLS